MKWKLILIGIIILFAVLSCNASSSALTNTVPKETVFPTITSGTWEEEKYITTNDLFLVKDQYLNIYNLFYDDGLYAIKQSDVREGCFKITHITGDKELKGFVERIGDTCNGNQ